MLLAVGFGVLVHVASLALLVLPNAATPSSVIGGALLLAGVVYGERLDLSVRGQLFGDLGFSVLLLLLFRIKDGRPVPFYWPLLLGAVWIELHASYALAIAVPLLWSLLAWLGGSVPATARRFAIAGLLALGGSFINPYFYRLPFDLARLAAARSTQQINLFQPAWLNEPSTAVAFVGILAVAIITVRSVETRAEGLILLLLACASAGSRRYLPLAAAFGIAPILRARVPWPRWLGHPGAGLAADCPRRLPSARRTPRNPTATSPVEEAFLVERLDLKDNVLNAYACGADTLTTPGTSGGAASSTAETCCSRVGPSTQR